MAKETIGVTASGGKMTKAQAKAEAEREVGGKSAPTKSASVKAAATKAAEKETPSDEVKAPTAAQIKAQEREALKAAKEQHKLDKAESDAKKKADLDIKKEASVQAKALAEQGKEVRAAEVAARKADGEANRLARESEKVIKAASVAAQKYEREQTAEALKAERAAKKAEQDAAKVGRQSAAKPKSGIAGMSIIEIGIKNEAIKARLKAEAELPRAVLIRKDTDSAGTATAILQCACNAVNAFPLEPFAQAGKVTCPKCRGTIVYLTLEYRAAAKLAQAV